jgi:membrane protein DedA with SNARE-associated domain
LFIRNYDVWIYALLLVAGVGAMTYSKFAIYNVTGAILWVGIIIFSVLPIIWEIAKAQLEKRRPPAA